MNATRNKETGMVYRGTDRVHIADGFRDDVGTSVAHFVDTTMRADAVQDGLLTEEQVYGPEAKALCPGCYMTAIYNAARQLAIESGQSLSELGRTMSAQFSKLMYADTGPVEEVYVLLDDPDDPPQDEPQDEPPPYLGDFGPNPLAPERDYGMVVGMASYGLDVGLVR